MSGSAVAGPFPGEGPVASLPSNEPRSETCPGVSYFEGKNVMVLPILAALLSHMPKYGVSTGTFFRHALPSAGSRRHTSSAVRLAFHPVVIEQNLTSVRIRGPQQDQVNERECASRYLSRRKIHQNTLRRSSVSIQSSE